MEPLREALITLAVCAWFSVGIPALIILAGWGLYSIL